jgi:hypothetical protein
MNLNYSRCKADLETSELNSENPPQHGYNNIDRIMDPKTLDEFYSKEEIRLKENTVDTSAIAYRFSNYYLLKLKRLCDLKKVELAFIYLAGYSNINKTPAFLSRYQKWGKVIMAPDSIYTNKTYWKDVAHLNTFGATAYTKFLATQLAR